MAEINVDVLQDMNDRKNGLAQLIADAQLDPTIDNSIFTGLFYKLASELELYKYSGDLVPLIAYLDEEIANDTNGYKSFLEGNTYLGYRVYDIILARLS